MRPYRGIVIVTVIACGSKDQDAQAPVGSVVECGAPPAAWIWCDDFEQDRLGQYFEVDDSNGDFARASGVGFGGSYGMRARWSVVGQVSAGSLHLAMGLTPQAYLRPVDAGTAKYRDVYWRVYVRNDSSWTGGGGDKMSRVQILANTSWAQAMIAPMWSGGSPATSAYLVLDPVSGTDEQGNLRAQSYGDNANLRFLGAVQGATPLFAPSHVGRWYCLEAHVRLNDPGQANGVFDLWIDGAAEARRTGLNWIGSYGEYGINTMFLENYWNNGAPRPQSRSFDRLVVSTQPIGC